MSGSAFVDTNVFIYAVDRAGGGKQRCAQQVLTTTPGVTVSPQVMNEFFVVVTRKLKTPLPVDEAAAMVRSMGSLGCVPIDTALVDSAIHIGRRWQLSHWDALMVAAAKRGACDRLLTEDLTHGADYGGVRIENPFR
ncbi:PIN domain-containing protein [Allosalinactinospora lopnorensis]|uniref:PIN domain-containing protein n=1 Tax=Allosalinactinospora lopnorensis TaxID=1352348 RepID=UPI000623D918|nr:PIN domain-containing protein [Allosalinactinospora lopnorensis]